MMPKKCFFKILRKKKPKFLFKKLVEVPLLYFIIFTEMSLHILSTEKTFKTLNYVYIE